MAIRNLHGHAVSSAAPMHHQQVTPANLKFMPTQGPADFNGGSGKSGFPPARGSKKPSSAPAQGQTGVSWATGPSRGNS